MIRKHLLAAILLSAVASPAAAEITFNIEEPAEGSVRSGIGLISGWAVSDVGIVSVEAFINGESLGLVPYGSPRGDVGAAFPNIPGSDESGWAMKWGYSLSGEGEHELQIVVTEQGGGTASKTVTFEAIRFDSEFIADPDDVETAGATLDSPEDGRLVMSGARIEGRDVDIELTWDTASQQFLIDHIAYDGEPKQQQSPTVQAGDDLSVTPGSKVTLTGSASDPDGHIADHRWMQVTGPTVALFNSNQWTVSFTAPSEAGPVRLRLEVTDNDGLTASDDVTVEVTEPANQAPSAWAGSDQTVDTGDSVSVTGTANDSDGTIASWSWTRVAGLAVTLQNADSQTVRFTAPASEGYTRLRLTVTDDDGATDSDEVVINFRAAAPSNQAPSANAGSDRSVDAGDSVTITGSGSDPDGSIVSWSWTQVSGTSVTLSGAGTQEVSFTAPDADATIRLRLTVTDDDGASDSDEVVITVAGDVSQTVSGNTVQSMLDDINAARGEGRYCGDDWFDEQPPFSWSASLADIAMQHSMDMAAQGYFSHTSLDGTTMGQRVLPYWDGGRVGENIATSTINRSDAYVVQMWLDSPGHCALIMSRDFTHAGVGFGHDPEGGWTNNGYTFTYFWTLDFGG